MSDTLDLYARVCNAFGYGTGASGPTCNLLVNEMLAELSKLREEIAEMENELRHARCAQDHAVMYANGERACAACGWIYK